MNHNTSAQCHTENGEVFLTDQSGNGHHRKQNKMKNTLKPLPSFVAEENTEDDIAWLHRQLEGEDDALTRAYRLGYQDGKRVSLKDKGRLDWLIDNNCEIYEPDTALLYCDCDRESIDEMMAQATRWSYTFTFTKYVNIFETNTTTDLSQNIPWTCDNVR